MIDKFFEFVSIKYTFPFVDNILIPSGLIA